jgi:hypothetical protein
MRLFRFFFLSFITLVLAGQGTEVIAWGLPANDGNDRSSEGSSSDKKNRTPASRDQAGIREDIPADTRQRYQNWKNELLSTQFGRDQWNAYATRKDFLLTITVAGTDDFEWNDEGKLVGAKITLGKNLDKGFPDPVYYPVMNSLATYDGLYDIDGDILASTKIIHEIGHVNFTATTNAKVFQKQNKLMASYNSIFLKNGYNTKDPQLVALAEELGAKPIEIWEDREYYSEVGAMRYLVERINGESFSCSVFSRMKRNISDYARNFHNKFDQIVGAGMHACRN